MEAVEEAEGVYRQGELHVKRLKEVALEQEVKEDVKEPRQVNLTQNRYQILAQKVRKDRPIVL